MKVPVALTHAFNQEFEDRISRFATDQGLLPESSAIQSDRFLSRSVAPHIERLSQLFNRITEDPEGEQPTQDSGVDEYWKKSSNPANLRLAYFLYFMPCNLFRVASVFAELSRLGYRWPEGRTLKGIEFGAGPASGACGVAYAERFASFGLPAQGNFALIEQDKAMLELGAAWAEECFESSWEVRKFHRKLELERGLLPHSAPKFNLWVMSYFLNESSLPPAEIAKSLLQTWRRHLEEDGIVALVEPALKLQSRRLLEIRKEILAQKDREGLTDLQLLLPCLGHQACGALAAAEDWCHEEVTWWRPPYFKKLDQMTGLDRKSLPFSYLVFTRSKKSRAEILPGLHGQGGKQWHRLVSPSHGEGKDLEFFVCGQDGKRRARYRPTNEAEKEISRGDILEDAEIRGDEHASRVERIKRSI